MKKTRKLFSLFAIMLIAVLSVGCVFATACGNNKEKDETEPEHVHDYTVLNKGDDDGHYYTCSEDDGAKGEVIPHTWGTPTDVTEATCGKDGSQTVTCTVCEYTTTQVLKATGDHKFGEWDSSPADCGNDEVLTRVCGMCGETETMAGEGKATGEHTYTETSHVDWTWTWDDGEGYSAAAKVTCDVCGQTADAGVTVEAPEDGELYGEYTATAKIGDQEYTDSKTASEDDVSKGYDIPIAIDFSDPETYKGFLELDASGNVTASTMTSGILTYVPANGSKIFTETHSTGTATTLSTANPTKTNSSGTVGYFAIDLSAYVGEIVKISIDWTPNTDDTTEARSIFITTNTSAVEVGADGVLASGTKIGKDYTNFETITYGGYVAQENSTLYVTWTKGLCLFNFNVTLGTEGDITTEPTPTPEPGEGEQNEEPTLTVNKVAMNFISVGDTDSTLYTLVATDGEDYGDGEYYVDVNVDNGQVAEASTTQDGKITVTAKGAGAATITVTLKTAEGETEQSFEIYVTVNISSFTEDDTTYTTEYKAVRNTDGDSTTQNDDGTTTEVKDKTGSIATTYDQNDGSAETATSVERVIAEGKESNFATSSKSSVRDSGVTYADYFEVKSYDTAGLMITIADGVTADITVYASHTNGSSCRTIYISQATSISSTADILAGESIEGSGSSGNRDRDNLWPVTATNLSAGTYYVYSGTSDTVHVYAVVITYKYDATTGEPAEAAPQSVALNKTEVALIQDENGQAVGEIIATVTMDTEGAVYDGTLAITEAVGVTFTQTNNAGTVTVAITVDYTATAGTTQITVTAAEGVSETFTLTINAYVAPDDDEGSESGNVVAQVEIDFTNLSDDLKTNWGGTDGEYSSSSTSVVFDDDGLVTWHDDTNSSKLTDEGFVNGAATNTKPSSNTITLYFEIDLSAYVNMGYTVEISVTLSDSNGQYVVYLSNSLMTANNAASNEENILKQETATDTNSFTFECSGEITGETLYLIFSYGSFTITSLSVKVTEGSAVAGDESSSEISTGMLTVADFVSNMNLSEETYSTDTLLYEGEDGTKISFTATAENTVAVATESSKSYTDADGNITEFSYVLKLSGAGSADARCLKIEVVGPCTVMLVVQSGTPANNSLALYDSNFTTTGVSYSVNGVNGNPGAIEFIVSAAGTYYIVPETYAAHIYAVQITYGTADAGADDVVLDIEIDFTDLSDDLKTNWSGEDGKYSSTETSVAFDNDGLVKWNDHANGSTLTEEGLKNGYASGNIGTGTHPMSYYFEIDLSEYANMGYTVRISLTVADSNGANTAYIADALLTSNQAATDSDGNVLAKMTASDTNEFTLTYEGLLESRKLYILFSYGSFEIKSLSIEVIAGSSEDVDGGGDDPDVDEKETVEIELNLGNLSEDMQSNWSASDGKLGGDVYTVALDGEDGIVTYYDYEHKSKISSNRLQNGGKTGTTSVDGVSTVTNYIAIDLSEYANKGYTITISLTLSASGTDTVSSDDPTPVPREAYFSSELVAFSNLTDSDKLGDGVSTTDTSSHTMTYTGEITEDTLYIVFSGSFNLGNLVITITPTEEVEG